jgi:hypothetical protein
MLRPKEQPMIDLQDRIARLEQANRRLNRILIGLVIAFAVVVTIAPFVIPLVVRYSYSHPSNAKDFAKPTEAKPPEPSQQTPPEQPPSKEWQTPLAQPRPKEWDAKTYWLPIPPREAK